MLYYVIYSAALSLIAACTAVHYKRISRIPFYNILYYNSTKVHVSEVSATNETNLFENYIVILKINIFKLV